MSHTAWGPLVRVSPPSPAERLAAARAQGPLVVTMDEISSGKLDEALHDRGHRAAAAEAPAPGESPPSVAATTPDQTTRTERTAMSDSSDANRADATTVLIDKATWDELQELAADGRRAAGRANAKALHAEACAAVDAAIAAGKLTARSREQYVAAYSKDPEATRTLLERLAPVLTPATAQADGDSFDRVMASFGVVGGQSSSTAAAAAPVAAHVAPPPASGKTGDVGDPATFTDLLAGFGLTESRLERRAALARGRRVTQG